MANIQIPITENGTTTLATAGKYCDRNIEVNVNVEGGDTETAYNEGRKDEYDRFWDAFQKNGTRTNYAYGFLGQGFNFANFYPKYDIITTTGNQLFYAWQTAGDGQTETSLKKRLEECGVRLDISQVTTGTQMFQYGYCLTELPLLDFSSFTTGTNIFYNCRNLVTIEKMVLTENTPLTGWFNGCTALENIVFEGTIGTNGLNLSYSPNLTHDSLMSVINALKDYSGTSTTRTVTFGSDNLAKLTDAEKKIATDKGWTLA